MNNQTENQGPEEKDYLDLLLEYKLKGIKGICSEIKQEATCAQIKKSRVIEKDGADLHAVLGLGSSEKEKARSTALANLVGFYSKGTGQEACMITDLDIPAAYKVYLCYLINSNPNG